MDRTLLVLLAEAWKTGEPGDVAALVDRIKEAPAEEVVETFLSLRAAASAGAALSALTRTLPGSFRALVEALAPVFHTLRVALQQQQAAQETPPQDPGPAP
jgi:hypothetical protein